MQRAILLCATLLATGLFTPAGVRAQFVSGRVIHASTEQALDAVNVEIHVSDGGRIARALTDTTGRFVMQASRTGTYSIVAERIGLMTVTGPLEVGVGEEVVLVIRMSEVAVAIEPLTVRARNRRNIGALAGYYDRVERNRGLGIGTIVTRDRIDQRHVFKVSDVMRGIPGLDIGSRSGRGTELRFRSRGRAGCSPKLYVDGMLANRGEPAYIDNFVDPQDLEGVEIYHGLSQMPGEFHDLSGCGVVLLWTRRTVEDGSPFSLKRLLVAGGLFGLLLLIF
jgi:hypothetical protein